MGIFIWLIPSFSLETSGLIYYTKIWMFQSFVKPNLTSLKGPMIPDLCLFLHSLGDYYIIEI